MSSSISQTELLVVDRLGKDFGNFNAVADVSLTVSRGELTAVIGPNGAGKTTLFNMLSGQLRPSHGRIFYKGEDVTRVSPHKLARRGIGRSFQITNVFRGLSVLENVRIAVQSMRHRHYDFFSATLRHGELTEKAESILEIIGLLKSRAAQANSLSHGDQRRLEIGIVLATDPELLLLDEPTAGMSREEARASMELLRRIARDKTVVFVEHNMEFVMEVSRSIVVMQTGSVIARGSPGEIRVHPDVRRAYLGNLYE